MEARVRRMMRSFFNVVPPASAYFVLVGIALVSTSVVVAAKGKDATGASLAVFGGGALIIAPFAGRLEGTLRLGPLEMTLRERAIAAVRRAPAEAVRGILPLLESEDVGVEQVSLPDALSGVSFTDPRLAFLRPELKLMVIAVRLSGEERWRAGGEVSDLVLPRGTELLVAGPRRSLREVRKRFDLEGSQGATET